jgi:hypothetical protein
MTISNEEALRLHQRTHANDAGVDDEGHAEIQVAVKTYVDVAPALAARLVAAVHMVLHHLEALISGNQLLTVTPTFYLSIRRLQIESWVKQGRSGSVCGRVFVAVQANTQASSCSAWSVHGAYTIPMRA